MEPTRLLRLPDVMRMTGLSRTTIYDSMSEGHFPKKRKLGSKTAIWIEGEVKEWMGKILPKQIPLRSGLL